MAEGSSKEILSSPLDNVYSKPPLTVALHLGWGSFLDFGKYFPISPHKKNIIFDKSSS